MEMKPWREVALPHRDIREGKFDESTFAADLSDVLADRGPLEYRDPESFFRKTYPTEGMVNLLAMVLARLAGKAGSEPIIQLQTPFGGGKTHSLIALYHLLTSGEEYKHLDLVRRVLDKAGVADLPKAGVAAFVGTAADPLKGKTPWGLIAEQLGRYKLLQEHDEKRQTPGKELLHRLLGGQPTLILMDELAEYAAKCIQPEKLREAGSNIEAARAYQTQVLAFLQELTETVKVLPQAAIVATLPSSAPYGEEGERALHQLQRIFGRMEAIYEPVRGEEIYEVIRRRLFEDLGDPKEARRVAEAYFELYQRLGEEVPAKARELAYREKLRKAYPFHPELIDLLFERWSTLPTFQRTRHVLWLLAEVISDLYRREHSAPLIQPAHVNLANPAIRTKLIQHIGPEYNGVIASDIADTNAKAQAIDRRMGSEYAPFAVASGLATAIFLYSFSGGELKAKGAGISQLRLAILREGIPPPIVGDALRKLEEDELWYLHVESGLYRFTSQPNLNRIMVEREDVISEEDIEGELHAWLEKLAGKELKVYLFPQAPEDIPDTRELKLALVAPEKRPAIKELLEKSGLAFRVYRNTLVALTADPQEVLDLRRQIKRYLALRSIHNDKSLMKQLSEENKKTLEDKIKDAEGRIPFQLLSAYRQLAKAGGGEEIGWHDLGLPTVGEKSTLAKRVRDFLKGQDLLLERIAPGKVLQKALGEKETEKPLKEIYESFLKYPHLPLLEGEQVLRQTVGQGVREGVFGLQIGERIYFNETVPSFTLEEAVLIRKEAVKKPEEEAEMGVREREGEEAEVGGVATKEREKGYILTAKALGARSFTLRARIPWDKMSDFFRGVLMPLHQDGADLKIEVLLQARSKEGIQRRTLEEKVKETLRQINAEVEEEQIEE